MYLGHREYSNQIKMQKYLHILSNTLLYARYILIVPDILCNVFYEIHETTRYPLQCIGYTNDILCIGHMAYKYLYYVYILSNVLITG